MMRNERSAMVLVTAVAATDRYSLYNTKMISEIDGKCEIQNVVV